MTFAIRLASQPRKFLEKCDGALRDRIQSRVRLLSDEPVPHNAVSVVGEERTFRVRVGDYRVLYEVFWKDNEILVAVIDKRPRAYGRIKRL